MGRLACLIKRNWQYSADPVHRPSSLGSCTQGGSGVDRVGRQIDEGRQVEWGAYRLVCSSVYPTTTYRKEGVRERCS